MVHYSCDRCYKIIDADEEARYTVRIEIQASVSSHSDLEGEDHLLELHELVERLENDNIDDNSPVNHKHQQHHLCPACYHAYMLNPLNQDRPTSPNLQLNFSRN